MPLRKRKKKQEVEIAEVPHPDHMDGETFVKHINKRHRKVDLPGFRIDVPYSPLMELDYFRSFHKQCHRAEVYGGTVNGQRPEYDHVHEAWSL